MLKTAESVRAGHPDKLCDFIADCILERALYEDPAARVAVEVLATKARVYVAGEITCSAKLENPMLVRAALEHVGYDPRRFRIRVRVHRQSHDIAGGVDQSLEARRGQQDAYAAIGAGDQGTVYGYATNETEERLPLPLVYAQRMCQRLHYDIGFDKAGVAIGEYALGGLKSVERWRVYVRTGQTWFSSRRF